MSASCSAADIATTFCPYGSTITGTACLDIIENFGFLHPDEEEVKGFQQEDALPRFEFLCSI
jgi:hypothetical protein